jgi:hypothetical protein
MSRLCQPFWAVEESSLVIRVALSRALAANHQLIVLKGVVDGSAGGSSPRTRLDGEKFFMHR